MVASSCGDGAEPALSGAEGPRPSRAIGRQPIVFGLLYSTRAFLQWSRYGEKGQKNIDQTASKEEASGATGIVRPISPRPPALLVERWRSAHQLRRCIGRLARATRRSQSCQLPSHRMDAARAHAPRLVGYPGVQPQLEACLPSMARRILAGVRSAFG